MTIIRVNPASVQMYGNSAQESFASMHASLVKLVNDVVSVHYFGPNAVAFKTECGQIATDFARSLHVDLSAMADAVRTSTTNIASSLGGVPITIQIDPNPITAPVPASVDYVDVDTAALEATVPVVQAQFASLIEALVRHLDALTNTDWQGTAKESAVGLVNQRTISARAKSEEARDSIVNYINKQVESVVTADR